ncbi:MAG: hypothetical protein L0I76_19940 [Pseudonocardia sp.]|nr:hypothetical protein [Pseudonocardia sp.]
MSDVLIRDVPPDDLARIRDAAAERGMSLQAYLLGTVRAQVVYLRRQDALAASEARLSGRSGVPAEERDAVRDAAQRALSEHGDGSVDGS